MNLKMIESEWKDCQRCPLGQRAFCHVLHDVPKARPIDLLVIGEGPGEGEDNIGIPFVGKSGKLLRRTMLETGQGSMTVAFSNLVACRPVNNDLQTVEIEACSPRLRALIGELKPQSILALGRLPEEHVGALLQDMAYQGRMFTLPHPASLLYLAGRQRTEAEIEYRRKFRELWRIIRISGKVKVLV